MSYVLPNLPYLYDALEPYFDARTMEIHYSKHHQAYVTNLNNAIQHTGLNDVPIERLITVIDMLPPEIQATVRNNGGGHANHSLFWKVLSPKGGKPSGKLAQAIDLDLKGYDAFKESLPKRPRRASAAAGRGSLLHLMAV
jgi:Fe-Mn family superoxide dismutase